MENIQYIINSNNRKTHVITPYKHIGIWDTDGSSVEDLKNDKSCWLQHYHGLLDLIEKKVFLSIKEWNKLYDEYFKYYNFLSPQDIQTLYFFRSDAFYDTTVDLQTHIKNLYTKYKLTNYRNEELSGIDYHVICTNIRYLSEYSFLQFFNTNFKIDLPIDNKRVQRLTERNRIFIYDLFTINEQFLSEEFMERQRKFIYSKKDIVDYISEYLYNSNNTQVYRAYQEANEKIFHLM
ncbi:hypothetical protein [Arcobacter sp.]|uniref:hypothetical protein n=1 Tax=Arcobacter sp. TaxID=1872629 RepID=UPI003D0A85A3